MMKIDQLTVHDDEVRLSLTGLKGLKGIHVAVLDLAGRNLSGWQQHDHDKGSDVAQVDLRGELADLRPGGYEVHVHAAADREETQPQPGSESASRRFHFLPAGPDGEQPVPPPPTPVTLQRTAATPTPDQVLWDLIMAVSSARRFPAYFATMRDVVCRDQGAFHVGAYETLAEQTREFLLGASIVDLSGRFGAYRTAEGLLPYVDSVVQRFPDARSGDPCSDIDLQALIENPFPVELIWSYWQEEAGLAQSLNHILARFQNRHTTRGPDRLARFDLSPLRPLRHLLWSWAEDEIGRLTLRRRAAEYEYEYGLSLVGRAVPDGRRYVERRNRFVESFHALLHEAQVFFEADDQTTVVADGFPVLNALRDTHLVLSEGAHNQFGDLPTEARIQMMIMQWILAQPEMRDFLGGRPMVSYDEGWMDRVDTMRRLQGWSSTSITHFNELAVYGEQLLLSIRWGHWNSTDLTSDSGTNWARTWRNAIQRYVHAYRAATGADLVSRIDTRMPALLLARREARERVRV